MEEMKAEERRRAIAKTLTAEHPVSATALAGQFSVSRQIIVGDIALLRAAGLDIVATPRGSKLGETLYGQMTGQLSLAARYDVRQFVEKAKHAAPLSSLTDGVHIHNLRCPSEEAYQRVCEDLKQLGILYTQGEPCEFALQG